MTGQLHLCANSNASSERAATIARMEIVLRRGIEVVLPALVYAKVLDEHAAAADIELIDRGPRPGRPPS